MTVIVTVMNQRERGIKLGTEKTTANSLSIIYLHWKLRVWHVKSKQHWFQILNLRVMKETKRRWIWHFEYFLHALLIFSSLGLHGSDGEQKYTSVSWPETQVKRAECMRHPDNSSFTSAASLLSSFPEDNLYDNMFVDCWSIFLMRLFMCTTLSSSDLLFSLSYLGTNPNVKPKLNTF